MISINNISSLRTNNILHNSNSNDIESNDIVMTTNDIRIDDSSLFDTIKNDKSLMTLFIVCGFYIKDYNDQLSTKILARAWQVILLVFACIGFCMQVFIIGQMDRKAPSDYYY